MDLFGDALPDPLLQASEARMRKFVGAVIRASAEEMRQYVLT